MHKVAACETNKSLANHEYNGALLGSVYRGVDTSELSEFEKALLTINSADDAEMFLLQFPQANIPVREFVEAGIYTREIFIPKGTIAVGLAHTEPFMQVVSMGKMIMFSDGGEANSVSAPFTGVGLPGYRKVGYALEDTIWTTFHACQEETDTGKIFKSTIVESSIPSLVDNAKEDVLDFSLFLKEKGLSADDVYLQSVDKSTYAPIATDLITLGISPIHGVGAYIEKNVDAGYHIIDAVSEGKRTQAGRYVNHAKQPNCQFDIKDGITGLYAKRKITKGEELTVDYRFSPRANGVTS